MLFDFVLNPKIWLALARQDAEPLVEALRDPVRLPARGQWATFLRNHDELDLSRLTDDQRADVFASFAPKQDMRIFGRGIRRRLASMMGGDRRRIELAYALQFALPGTPVLRYGDEIGMGENLALPGRSAHPHADAVGRGPRGRVLHGAVTAAAPPRARPAGSTGPDGSTSADQQRDPDSLLRWFENLIDSLRGAPEIGTGECSVLDLPLPRSVLAHRFDAASGAVLLLHNLADTPVTVDIGALPGVAQPYDLLVDGPYDAPTRQLRELELHGLGYRWIRLRRADRW